MQQMEKERWFNNRPICLIFLFLMLGSVFAFYLSSTPEIALIVFSIVFFALFLLFLKINKIKTFVLIFLAFVIGAGAYNLTTYNFYKNEIVTPSQITARISTVGKANDSYLYIEADSVKLDGKEINSNIVIYLYDTDSLYSGIEIGRKITFSPNSFYQNDLYKYETPQASLITSNLKYTSSANMGKVALGDVDKTFAETIKQKIKENLKNGLSNENVEIAYSSLFGEKELLSDSQYSAYKLSGVAHLLAVSGLHVGIIVGILNFFLKRIKYRKWIKLVAIAPFLLFYMYICNFAFSIIRATIMSIMLLISDSIGTEYDSLCSISIAGIVIYCINPLCVFDISFLMSFMCVLGIAMFNKPINKMLSYIKCPKALSSSISLSLSSTISLLFIMAFYFQNLNVISILANIILIPIFTIAFVVIFIISIIALILPFISQLIVYLLYPLNYIFDFVNIIATALGNLSISNFNTLSFNYIAILIYFMLLLIMGRYCTSKYKYKVAATLPIVTLLFYCLI